MAGRALKIDSKQNVRSDAEYLSEVTTADNVTEAEISARAYELWHERGCPIGSAEEDWFKAEFELRGGRAKTSRAS
jgi:regulation of enolase protein 1 (concanavalin A-like superfamily)